jgi:heptosyltransferase I
MKNILIIRPSAIGDIVMASPMIQVLRRNYPDARLVWLVEPTSVDLLKANKNLDELIVWNKKEWRELFQKGRLFLLRKEISKFAGQLKRKKFDLAIDAQGLLRSRLLAWLSGAPDRIGFESKEPGRFLMTRVTSKGHHTGIMGSEYRHMMDVLGLNYEGFHPEIAISEEDEASVRRILESLKIEGGYAVLAPFTTRPQKHWFEDRWVDLTELVHRTFGLPSLLLGGKSDFNNASSIIKSVRVPAYNLAGLTGLGQSAAIIRASRLLIGVDTGMTHMGAAFDVATVALFGATCPYLYTSGKRTSVIYNCMRCSPCRRSPVCGGDFTCMRSIEAEHVITEATKLLGHSN